MSEGSELIIVGNSVVQIVIDYFLRCWTPYRIIENFMYTNNQARLLQFQKSRESNSKSILSNLLIILFEMNETVSPLHNKRIWRLHLLRKWYVLIVTFNYSIIKAIKKWLPISSDYYGMGNSYNLFFISSEMRFVWGTIVMKYCQIVNKAWRENIRMRYYQKSNA